MRSVRSAPPYPTATWPAGSSARRCITRCVRWGWVTHADAAIAAYRADYTTRGWAMNSLFDGIAELLADLDAAGVRLAVATSKAEPTAQRIVAHFGLDRAFRGRRRRQRRRFPRDARPTWWRTRWPNWGRCRTGC